MQSDVPRCRLQDFVKEFPGASDFARDLLTKMLTFNPAKRCTVQDVLEHPFLDSVRKDVNKDAKDRSKREASCKARKYDNRLERDFPMQTEMPKDLLQREILT